MNPGLCLKIVLAATLLAFAVPASADLFAMTYQPGSQPMSWVYTLYNNSSPGPDAPVVLGLDLNWDDLWNESQPRPDFQIIGPPPDTGWVEYAYVPWPAWDAATTNEPTAGNSFTGFAIAATSPQLTSPPV